MDIEFHAPGYRIIETPEMQTDDHGNRCYAIVDESSRVVWLFARTIAPDQPPRDQVEATEALRRTPSRSQHDSPDRSGLSPWLSTREDFVANPLSYANHYSRYGYIIF